MVRQGEGYLGSHQLKTTGWTRIDGETWWKHAKDLNGPWYKHSIKKINNI